MSADTQARPAAALALFAILDRALGAMWPRRTHQELLLDLGERKGWDADDRAEALAESARWMADELRLDVPHREVPAEDVTSIEALHALRIHGNGRVTNGGVGRWVETLAPAVGTGPKTLSNSLSKGLRPDRADHRWALAIARIASGAVTDAHVDAWSYHLRTPTNTAALLSKMGAAGHHDVGDAVLLFSLLSLWQRRRPTEAVRSNRGRPRSRRTTPKPVASLAGSLVSHGQIPHLLGLARTIDGGRLLARLTLEAALTEAHVAPHLPRGAPRTDTPDGESWLRMVDAAVADLKPLLGAEDCGAFAFRVESMRAWRDRRAIQRPIDTPEIPYVQASLALAAWRNDESHSLTCSSGAPGVMMLLPLLRRREFEIRP